MSGWIKIHRDINKHWIWQNSDYLRWWIDILLEVNHTDAKVVIKNKIYTCKRGQKLYSLDTWATRWNTNKSKVRRFLNLLQNDAMIELKSETQTTRLTVCKYEDYQDFKNANETHLKQKRNANETHLTPIQECKEEKEEKENIINQINWKMFLHFFNKSTNKNCRVVSDKVKNKINARLKEGYTKEDIFKTIVLGVKDSFHIENNYKYFTLEYISRSNTIDKYSNIEFKEGTNQKLMKYGKDEF